MPSIFTRIIDGELPGQFVWRDETCVAFLSIAPLRPGHTLVVPRVEVDHWIDVEAPIAAHLMTVAHTIGRAQMRAFSPTRIGLIIAGMEVPHTHVHVVPIDSEADLDFSRARGADDDNTLEDTARRLREALATLGHPLT